MVRTSTILDYTALLAVSVASCLTQVLPGTAVGEQPAITAQGDPAADTQDSIERSAELTELLERLRSFSRGGMFGQRPSDRHVQDAAGRIIELRLRKVELRPGDAQIIAGLDALEKLDLQESNVSDDDVRLLEALPALKHLSLRGTDISGIALASIGRMQALTQLDISRTKISDRDLRHLEDLLNLSYVILDRTPVTDSGLEVLGAMPQLARISLGQTKITDGGLHHLRKLPRLRGLTLDDTEVTEQGLEQIAQLPGFAWIATPSRVVNEYLQRIELGQFAAAREMFVAGVTIPERGTYQLLSLEAVELSEKDRKRGRQRFNVQMHWVDKTTKTDEILHALLVIDRGAVLIAEVGIDDPAP